MFFPCPGAFPALRRELVVGHPLDGHRKLHPDPVKVDQHEARLDGHDTGG
jgi:hypothetical protein